MYVRPLCSTYVRSRGGNITAPFEHFPSPSFVWCMCVRCAARTYVVGPVTLRHYLSISRLLRTIWYDIIPGNTWWCIPCCCCCCHINSHRLIKSVVTGQAPVTFELRNTQRKNTNKQRWYTHTSWYITADTIHASARNTWNRNRESVCPVAGPYHWRA